jgi:hypothetical protein
LFRALRQRRPLLVLTDLLIRAAQGGLPAGRKADSARVFVHFGRDDRAGVPVVYVYETGQAYLMEIAYKDRLARVMLAVLAELQPLCAITIGPLKPVHPNLLWPRLLCTLDGPPWFVLCSLMRTQRPLQNLGGDERHLVDTWKGEHASP